MNQIEVEDKMLKHETIEDRQELIDKAFTQTQLQIDIDTLSKYSEVEVLSHCVICKNTYVKKYRAILAGKGLTCSKECSHQFKCFKQKINRLKETEETKARRKEGKDLFYQDKDRVQEKIDKMKKTNLERYGTEVATKNNVIKKKVSEGLQERYKIDKESINNQRKQTNLEKYGVDNYFKLQEFKEDLRQQNQEKHGVDYVMQLPEFSTHRKKVLLEKYGAENPGQIAELVEKRKQTCIERYGCENPRQSLDVQKKIEDTCEEKFGVRNLLASEEFRKKSKASLREKYGVENPFELPELYEKGRKTCLERYGVEYMNQLPENRDNLKNWCEQHPELLFTSKPELEILNWIKQYYPSAHKIRIKGQEIDIFIPELNLGIEYNGLYYHCEFKKPNSYHITKTKFFKDLDIRIIHIWGHEWNCRKEQIKSFILSAIKKNSFRLKPKEVEFKLSFLAKDIKEVQKFMDSYHIQGKTNGVKFVIKVLYNSTLIGCATFGKHHRNATDWVLSRFCTKTDYTIVGGLGKISKLASRQLKADIVSWADYRLSLGNGYEKAGWEFEELLKPDYFYWRISGRHKGIYHEDDIISKQSRQKNIVGTPEEMTEHDHAKLDNLVRIYDCGKMRFRYKYR